VSATISKALYLFKKKKNFINCRADDNAITLSTKKKPMYCKWYANLYIQVC